jgi:uncharacterized integral membrane protein (TIGR00698 family)
MKDILKLYLLPGVLLSGLIGILSMGFAAKLPWLTNHGLSVLTIALLLGILLGNLPVFRLLAASCLSGVQFSKQRLLRLGIILYGFRLTFQDVVGVGVLGLLIDLFMILSTFGLAIFLGVRYLKLDRNTAILIGIGNSICGAAAVLAAEPVIDASSEKVSVAISTVVIFGTISIFAYPMIYGFSQLYLTALVSPSVFGIYIGSSVHEVAQVLAAASAIGDNVADSAVIAKMVRVMMLGPFLIGLSAYLIFSDRVKDSEDRTALGNSSIMPAMSFGSTIPWFALFFVLMIAINSLKIFPDSWRSSLVQVDDLLLATAMAALGMTTHLLSIFRAGMKPLQLAALLFLWLVLGGALISLTMTYLWSS